MNEKWAKIGLKKQGNNSNDKTKGTKCKNTIILVSFIWT